MVLTDSREKTSPLSPTRFAIRPSENVPSLQTSTVPMSLCPDQWVPDCKTWSRDSAFMRTQ